MPYRAGSITEEINHSGLYFFTTTILLHFGLPSDGFCKSSFSKHLGFLLWVWPENYRFDLIDWQLMLYHAGNIPYTKPNPKPTR